MSLGNLLTIPSAEAIESCRKRQSASTAPKPADGIIHTQSNRRIKPGHGDNPQYACPDVEFGRVLLKVDQLPEWCTVDLRLQHSKARDLVHSELSILTLLGLQDGLQVLVYSPESTAHYHA